MRRAGISLRVSFELFISEVCTECSTARIQARAQHVENYRYGTIYVRKLTKDHSEKDIEQVLNDVSILMRFLSFTP